MARKIHLVREDQSKTLCGRRLMTKAFFELSLRFSGVDLELLLEDRRKSIFWDASGCRPFITVEEFIEGNDSPDCCNCRKKLDAVLQEMINP